MQPRTRAQRHQEAEAAVGKGPGADEAITREWAAQRAQREQLKAVEIIADREESLRQLETEAHHNGDEGMLAQAAQQRANLLRDRERYHVPEQAAPTKPAVAPRAGGGDGPYIPPPMAFDSSSPSHSPKARAPAVGPSRQGLYGAAAPSPSLFGLPGAPQAAARPPVQQESQAAAPPWMQGGAPAHGGPPGQAMAAPASLPFASMQSPQMDITPRGPPTPGAPVGYAAASGAGVGAYIGSSCGGGGPCAVVACASGGGGAASREEFLRRRQQQNAERQRQEDRTPPTQTHELNQIVGPSGFAAAPLALQAPLELGLHALQQAQQAAYNAAVGPPLYGVAAAAQQQGQMMRQHSPFHQAAPPHLAFVGAPAQGNLAGPFAPSPAMLSPHGYESSFGQGTPSVAAAPPFYLPVQTILGHVTSGQPNSPPLELGLELPSQRVAAGGPPSARPRDPAAEAKRAYGEELRQQAEQDKMRRRMADQSYRVEVSPPRESLQPPQQPQAGGEGMFAGLGVDHARMRERHSPHHIPSHQQQPPQQQHQSQDRDSLGAGPGLFGGLGDDHARIRERHSPPPPVNRNLAQNPMQQRPPQQPGGSNDPGGGRDMFSGMGEEHGRLKEKLCRQEQDRHQLVQPSPTPAHGRYNPTDLLDPPRAGILVIGRVSTAEEDEKNKKREEMRRILAMQVEESQLKKKTAERKRKEEDEADAERIRRDQDEMKRKDEAEKGAVAEKRRRLQEENEQRASGAPPASSHGSAADRNMQRRSCGSRPPLEPCQENESAPPGRDAHLFGALAQAGSADLFSAPPPPGPNLFSAPAVSGHGLFGAPPARGPSDFFGAPPASSAAPPWEVDDAPRGHAHVGNMFQGIIEQQQGLYRQQQGALERLQAETERLRAEKDAAKESLLEFKERQLDEKEKEVRLLQKQLQRQVLLGGGGLACGLGFLAPRSPSASSQLGEADEAAPALGDADCAKSFASGFYSKYEAAAATAATPAATRAPAPAASLAAPPGVAHLTSHAAMLPVPSPEEMGKSGDWSLAPLPWLQAAEPGHRDGFDSRGDDNAFPGSYLFGSADALDRRPLDAGKKRADALEESLFEESWGRPLSDSHVLDSGGGEADVAGGFAAQENFTSQASQSGPWAVGTLAAESKLVGVDDGQATWQDAAMGRSAGAAAAKVSLGTMGSIAESDRFGETAKLATSPPQRTRPRITSAGSSVASRAGASDGAGRGSAGPVSELVAAVRAIREARGEEYGEEPDAQTLYSPMASRTPAASSFAGTRGDAGGGLDDDFPGGYGGGPSTRASAIQSGDWGGVLRRLGGEAPQSPQSPLGRGARSFNSLDAGDAQSPVGRDSINHLARASSRSFGSIDAGDARIPAMEDSVDRLARQGTSPASSVGMSIALRNDDFAALAASPPEDFDAFLSRLKAKANASSAAAATRNHGASGTSSGNPSVARRDGVRTGSPALRAAAVSALRSGSTDAFVNRPTSSASRPGSGGSAMSAGPALPTLRHLRQQRRKSRTAEDVAPPGGGAPSIPLGAPGIGLHATVAADRGTGSSAQSALEALRSARRPPSRDRFIRGQPPPLYAG